MERNFETLFIFKGNQGFGSKFSQMSRSKQLKGLSISLSTSKVIPTRLEFMQIKRLCEVLGLGKRFKQISANGDYWGLRYLRSRFSRI